MGLLNSKFKKVEKAIKLKAELLKQKEALEESNKDNEILMKYIKILEDITKQDKELSDAKTYMYESMLEEDKDKLEGTFCDITLKRPYEKTDFNLKAFLQDYKPTTALYKKYVSKKEIKGNIVINILDGSKKEK